MKKMINIYKKDNKIDHNKFTISLIIPCRNEEKFIGGCLNSIIANDYPKDKLEILVIDGLSEDRTREIVKRYIGQYSYIKLLNNSKKYTPYAFNIGIKYSKADIIMIMGAHATYENDYISKCIKYLYEYNADNTGGVWKIVPRSNTIVGKSIALALSNFFGGGNAYYRTGNFKEPKWVDTVFGGCYKREIFEKIGYFNENLIRTQDLEFNLRLRKSGGRILLCPDIVAYYIIRSDIRSFCRYNFINSFWVTYPRRFLPYMPVSWRHLVPLLFVISLTLALLLSLLSSFFFWLFLSIAGVYLLSNLIFSFMIAFREKNIGYMFVVPVLFALLHVGYGLGSLWGLIKSYQKEVV